jgi:hypothetical protein
MDEMNRVRNIVIAAAAVAAMVVGAPTAGADPETPVPSPPYQILTPGGPVYGGLRTLPPVCAAQPLACNLTWNPNTGAWDAPPGDQ